MGQLPKTNTEIEDPRVLSTSVALNKSLGEEKIVKINKRVGVFMYCYIVPKKVMLEGIFSKIK